MADLKPVQVKELKDTFEALEKEGKGHKSVKPDRMTRAQSREVVVTDEAEVIEAEEGEIGALDPFISSTYHYYRYGRS